MPLLSIGEWVLHRCGRIGVPGPFLPWCESYLELFPGLRIGEKFREVVVMPPAELPESVH